MTELELRALLRRAISLLEWQESSQSAGAVEQHPRFGSATEILNELKRFVNQG